VETVSRLDDLQSELVRSESAIARQICEISQGVPLTASSDCIASFDTLAPTLRTRAKLKQMQLERAVSASSKHRFEVMGAAISAVLEWWDHHGDVALRYTCLTAPPDVAFIVWSRSDNGAIVGGFESRDATRLAYERGKAFFGDDWEPTPDPGV
jgi:hypothetical protein